MNKQPVSYGVIITEEEKEEMKTWHKTTWFEQEIPEALEEEIQKIVDERVKLFEKKCGCGICKLHSEYE